MRLGHWLAWRALWWAWPRLTTDQQARFLVVVLTMEKRYDLLVTMGLGAPGGSEESKPLT